MKNITMNCNNDNEKTARNRNILPLIVMLLKQNKTKKKPRTCRINKQRNDIIKACC